MASEKLLVVLTPAGARYYTGLRRSDGSRYFADDPGDPLILTYPQPGGFGMDAAALARDGLESFAAWREVEQRRARG